MTESEGEIEYLDEDADIVQQCVKSTLVAPINVPRLKSLIDSKQLLVERVPTHSAAKRKKPQGDDSSDYDPVEDLRSQKKRKPQTPAKSLAVSKAVKQYVNTKIATKVSTPHLVEPPADVKMHDHDDPMCLPVKFWSKDVHDALQLRKWNNLCLSRLRSGPDGLKPKTGDTVYSKRVVILRNVTSNLTRRPETTVWSKTVVQNKDGEKNTEVVQSILPKYREKVMLEYNMPAPRKKKTTRTTNTVLLCKEGHKDGEALVAYQPSLAVSSVYKLVDQPEITQSNEDTTSKRYLQQTANVKICAPCYQTSWRPTRDKNSKKPIVCPICRRGFLSVYNLLSHTRTHQPADVRKHRSAISRTLAKKVDYHYKCRICQKSFTAIRELRKHVATHISKEKFLCEVGNHLTQ